MRNGATTGSEMSSKQLAWTVVDGRLLTFHLLNGDSINGYLCGMDDFHWMIVTVGGKKHLIHKAAAALIDIASEPTYGEHRSSALEEVISPFRQVVERGVFGRVERVEVEEVVVP